MVKMYKKCIICRNIRKSAVFVYIYAKNEPVRRVYTFAHLNKYPLNLSKTA